MQLSIAQMKEAVRRRFAIAKIAKRIKVVPSLSLDSGDQIDAQERWLPNGLVKLEYTATDGAVLFSQEFYDESEAWAKQATFVGDCVDWEAKIQPVG